MSKAMVKVLLKLLKDNHDSGNQHIASCLFFTESILAMRLGVDSCLRIFLMRIDCKPLQGQKSKLEIGSLMEYSGHPYKEQVKCKQTFSNLRS